MHGVSIPSFGLGVMPLAFHFILMQYVYHDFVCALVGGGV